MKPEWLDSVAWKDLLTLSRFEIICELLISSPWLLASWFMAGHEWIVLALGCSFMFFLTGLRQVHNAYHFALGLSRPVTEGVMFVMSILMLGSMHAVQLNHLCHHAHCMESDDIEAQSARLSWWRAILAGPLFPWRLHYKALRTGNSKMRAWVIAETLANVVWIALVFGVLNCKILEYHVTAMAIGQCLTSFFAVWTVHHDAAHAPGMSRTVRGRIRSWLTYNMFFHMEHHLFPRVPTCNLRRLAERIDGVAHGAQLKMAI